MKLLDKAEQLQKGTKIVYNDGRAGHSGVTAIVMEVNSGGMHVLFEDRADSNFIAFGDKAWMDHIEEFG